MIELKDAVAAATAMLNAMYPNLIQDSILLEELEDGGDKWTVGLSFSVPATHTGDLASGIAYALRGSTIRRIKRFTLDAEGKFLSMKDMNP